MTTLTSWLFARDSFCSFLFQTLLWSGRNKLSTIRQWNLEKLKLEALKLFKKIQIKDALFEMFGVSWTYRVVAINRHKRSYLKAGRLRQKVKTCDVTWKCYWYDHGESIWSIYGLGCTLFLLPRFRKYRTADEINFQVMVKKQS